MGESNFLLDSLMCIAVLSLTVLLCCSCGVMSSEASEEEPSNQKGTGSVCGGNLQLTELHAE